MSRGDVEQYVKVPLDEVLLEKKRVLGIIIKL